LILLPALRQHFLQERLALNEKKHTEYTQCAVRNFASYLNTRMPARCALYYPIKGEMSPLGICNVLPAMHWALPVIIQKGMTFHDWHPDNATRHGAYQINEPIGTELCIPDIIITPLLAVDRQGYRLGYGKGYYDRYFAAHPHAMRIGLGFELQYCDTLPHERHDIPLHHWIHEKGITSF
jgi:5-formyltetrahydrofolate cyclo-ligase